jgi:hypothetical protein
MTYKTGFIVQGNTEDEKIVNTDDKWLVYHNKAYAPIPFGPISFNTYYVAGPGEKIDGTTYPWGWEQREYDDQAWQKPRLLYPGSPHGTQGFDNWQLVARNIPMLEKKEQRFAAIRRSSGVTPGKEFISGKAPLNIPANTTATILLDQQVLTTAYPRFMLSGGKGSEVKVSYSEAMWDDKGKKGNRNEVEGRKMIGNYDIFLPDGESNRTFIPLFYRTFRYVQLDITTAEEPLLLLDVNSQFVAYPFRDKATFASSDLQLAKVWEVGWRTARLCAFETYMDCPYYEQLQYIGDTRIQALISLYMDGDDKLMRNAIEQIDHSRIPEGITQSRYPTDLPQFIPPFSLFWVSMINDYWMYRRDDAFVKQFLPGISQVLGWFERRVNDKNMIEVLPYWNFIDHSYPVEKIAENGNQSLSANNLSFAYSLRHAAQLYDYFGKKQEANHYTTLANTLTKAVYEQCYDTEKKMIADTPDKNSFSQQVNVLAVLTDAISQSEQADLLKRTLADTTIIQSTIYYQFYHFQAMKKTGLGDMYLASIQPWRNMLNEGLTTFAETEKNTRSDCHAWSASPNYDLLSTVCGIMPSSPGFRTVTIAPNLGKLTFVKGTMPHPDGEIKLDLKLSSKNKLTGTVTLPATVQGKFVWNGKESQLKSGTQKIAF